jgi:hypothetical protein
VWVKSLLFVFCDGACVDAEFRNRFLYLGLISMLVFSCLNQ